MSGSISSMYNNTSPLVAIVGRPNVGKSTLFNRLVGKRQAITDPTPGVTRDPIECLIDIDGRAIRIFDTGGFKVEGNALDNLVTEKSKEVIEKASVILLLVDVTEITPEDETFIEYLRPKSDKILMVVNKVDNEKRENEVYGFSSFGFSVIGVSAAHGRNLDGLREELSRRFKEVPLETDLPSEPEIRVAIVGKPNTGKSTLTNLLTNTENSIVSDVPGTTRDVIEGDFFYKNRKLRVIDTAGIRRKSRVEDQIEYYSVNRAIKTMEAADLVFLLITADEQLSDQDKKIASLAVKKGKGIILVLSKWDKLENVPNLLQAVSDRVRFIFPVLAFAPIVPISALRKEGIDNLLSTAVKVWSQLNKQITTGPLNKKLEAWQQRYSPASGNNRVRYKTRYITQVGTNPIRFFLFVNRKKGFPSGYIQYLTNNLRKEFGFSNVPINFEIRERT